jgi:hypothetical protein
MRVYFEWLGKHEKLVVAVTLCLVIAFVVQIKFCRVRVEPEANLPQSQPQASTIAQSSGPTNNIAGVWEMSVQKWKGGTQTWTLTLEQEGAVLKGMINSEGGDLLVTGTIEGQSINLAAKRFGVTVDFPATLEGDRMIGVMRALAVTRQWTAKRK